MSKFTGKLTPSLVIKAYKAAKYRLFEKGDYNLNIFGIRTDDMTSNTFNDLVGILYKEQGKWKLFYTAATTDPGVYYRENPMNIEGTAILQPGQHRGAFRIGKHRGQYTALVQNVPLPLWRDNDGDGHLTMTGETHMDLAGINLHRATSVAGNTSKLVDKWSAGCQVIASNDEYDKFIAICEKSQTVFPGSMTYSLFTESNFG